ncbi:restriction endonuclease subunit S [Bacillus sonorensis]|uniref:restriction endonuclease subunit S n=1 Tax=Bacillus sonorensis TaxID=119858 RepID=UPI002DB5A98B|nr:restriction endonuclease subunit S [Bacillus sonorensis]MEC1352554.1 restriction endonuclease subunit S [Bacillus sonorensis]MEC1426582.1 restriction endonuclease subunit S [Bacillus sonorensis]
MDTQDLKNSIFHLAIQGKLVEQREEEGTTKELLEKINTEREQLIKEKKIKKKKEPPEIKKEEIPFDIPESWEWVRLVQIGEIIGGGTPKTSIKEFWDGGDIPWLTPADMKNVIGKYVKNGERFITSAGLKGSSARLMPKGTIIYSSRAPIGYIAIADNDLCTNQGFKSLVPFDFGIIEYVYYCLISRTSEIISRASGTTFKEISGSEFGQTIIPLPPLEEQKRIVAKIEELMPYVDKYDKAYSEVNELNKKFPDDMQKSILQYAIQGKLVEQREEEGTAEELYQQIQEEKKNLVKEGKVKKPKKLMEITEDEIPYDIPENWKWVRFGDVFEINPRNTVNDDTTVSFIPMALIEDGYRSEFSYETKSWGDVKKGYTHFKDGDIVIAKITPCFQNLKSAIMTKLDNGVGAGTTELHVLRAYSNISLEFFLWFVKSPIFISTCVSKMTGTAGQQRVGTDTIRNYVVPLPPLEEQKRIVAKIEEMLPHCKQLVK